MLRGRGLFVLSIACVSAVLSASSCSGSSACDYAYGEIIKYLDRCSNDLLTPEDVAETKARAAGYCRNLKGAPGSEKVDQAYTECGRELATGNASCGGLPRACTSFAGEADAGAKCANDTQCASGRCQVDPKAKPGFCGRCVATMGAGGMCQSSSQCNRGLVCVMNVCTATKGEVGDACESASDCKGPNHCKMNKCAAPIAENGACESFEECVKGTSCISGTCSKQVGEGAACARSLDCIPGLVCDASDTKRCVKPTFVEAGEACGALKLCKRGACRTVPGDDGGAPMSVCPRIIGDGEKCDPNSATAQCDVFAGCYDGTCQIPNPQSCIQ